MVCCKMYCVGTQANAFCEQKVFLDPRFDTNL
uniref:Uncharacterized protein n=1 Tax=Rhizophora mucronata TaxID=61149 RepID=A0A2P2NVJ1_RHIMU